MNIISASAFAALLGYIVYKFDAPVWGTVVTVAMTQITLYSSLTIIDKLNEVKDAINNQQK